MKRQSPEARLFEAIYGPMRDFKTNPTTPAERRAHKKLVREWEARMKEEDRLKALIAQKPRNVAARARRAARTQSTKISEDTRTMINCSVIDTHDLIKAHVAMECAILQEIMVKAQMAGAECSGDHDFNGKDKAFYEAVVDRFIEACDEARAS